MGFPGVIHTTHTSYGPQFITGSGAHLVPPKHIISRLWVSILLGVSPSRRFDLCVGNPRSDRGENQSLHRLGGAICSVPWVLHLIGLLPFLHPYVWHIYLHIFGDLYCFHVCKYIIYVNTFFCVWVGCSWNMFTSQDSIYGCFLKWWYPHFTPQVMIIFTRKTLIVGYHYFWKPPSPRDFCCLLSSWIITPICPKVGICPLLVNSFQLAITIVKGSFPARSTR